MSELVGVCAAKNIAVITRQTLKNTPFYNESTSLNPEANSVYNESG